MSRRLRRRRVTRDDRGPGWRAIGPLLVMWLVAAYSSAAAVELVRGELGKTSVVVGEAVPLIVTLYSPGPFSGVASFELPEMDGTVFTRIGNPVVGSESIGGETFFTQRHEFAIYTQQTGDVAIPAFSVRFASKPTYASPPEAKQGWTAELHFQSTRPPGTEQLGLVVAARSMEAKQTWQPGADAALEPGETIKRTIVRRATDTTAMLFPPVPLQAPVGVRCYAADPLVQDVTERGATRAERSETITYQFSRPGSFRLPDVVVVWWDPEAGALQRETLPGKAVEVRDAPAAAEPVASASRADWRLVVAAAALGGCAWLACRRAVRRLAARSRDPVNAAARRALASCRANAPHEAYAAVLDWQRAVEQREGASDWQELLDPNTGAAFAEAWQGVAQHVYGAAGRDEPWTGQQLAAAFRRVRGRLRQAKEPTPAQAALPALNPENQTENQTPDIF